MAQSSRVNRRVVLASRPTGAATLASFRLEQTPVPDIREGEVLLRTLWLSLDPYMRGRMSDAPSYTAPVQLGEVMIGGTVGRVEKSQLAGFAPGETVVVAAATGAVGSVVGQIAKLNGCRAVGIAGGKAKCDWAVSDLGFDACIDHHGPALTERLAGACPQGVDVYFENVGGRIFEAVLPLLNPRARIPVCGLISQYNAAPQADPPAGGDWMAKLMRTILVKRLTLRGFIIFDDYGPRLGEFGPTMEAWLRAGRIKYREDVVQGLENAPGAFLGLLEGRNFGKLVVEVGPREVPAA
jgi:NADPH-dependent curcumin reductase CurA